MDTEYTIFEMDFLVVIIELSVTLPKSYATGIPSLKPIGQF